MNGTLCADVVSRLPNEVSNYEPCYFLCGAGCDQGEEGTQREEDEEEEGGIEREQWMRDRRVKKGNPNNVRQRQQQRERASTHY